MLITHAYKWRPYHQHERKAAVLVENIEYSIRMFKDIIEECKLVDDFEAVLRFITPSSGFFLLMQPQSQDTDLVASLSEEAKKRCDAMLQSQNSSFQWHTIETS